MTIGEEILELLKVKIMQDEDLDIEMGEDLLTSGTLDSMALIRLVAAIEEKYAIKIPPTDLVIENFMTISAMEEYVGNQVSK